MKKSEMLLELAKSLGAKNNINVSGDLWGYGKIKYNEEKCIGCGKCEENCSEEAIKFSRVFDLPSLFKIQTSSSDSKKDVILNLTESLN